MISTMYRLCTDNKWFTRGTVEQYEKLFRMVEENRSTRELALAIYICSDSYTENEIYTKLCEGGFTS